MGLAYYKRYPRDFLEGTADLSFEERGAYGLFLDLLYIHEGRVPDNDAYVSRQIGCSIRRWGSFRKTLVEKGKLYVTKGFIANFRADFELESLSKFRDKQSENASKPRKNKPAPQPKPSHPYPYPEPDREKLSAQEGAERVSLLVEVPLIVEAVARTLTGATASGDVVVPFGRGIPKEKDPAAQQTFINEQVAALRALAKEKPNG